MSYLPPFTTDLEMRNPDFSLSLQELETELDVARTQALFAYQQQVMCVTRLIKEVKTLREQLDLQHEKVEHLSTKLELEKQKRHEIERRFLMYKLKTTQQLLDNFVPDSSVQEPNEHSNSRELKQEMAQSEETVIQTLEGAESCE
ncbi:uncharacterized protein si:dkeyp-50b9.1 [Myxocyprinus asiaticus]|uniref:uncharacterized protein si:dkeyp-50b9.1 n=1 Tax=Myxocyprinus asiaticus TaxID=70543 RepID=UPI0022227AAD|nr:uncharacterized protein si:dkeyp-50b9.1 [Myxocyprinus asiaticus]